VCVNFRKAIDVVRDEKLTNRVTKQSGRLAGHICAAALLQLQGVWDPSEALSNRPPGAVVDAIHQVQVNVDRLLLDANAQDFPTTAAQREGTFSAYQPSPRISERNGHINGYPQNGHHDPITPECIEQQLQILSEEESPFISHNASGKWIIDVQSFRHRLLKAELFHYIRNRFGLTALRIIRILADKGKVDEKWLQEIGLLSAKDLRQSLANLHSNGFIELQEIPREPQRQPNRTIFLWFFDLERAQKVLLDNIYKSMARLLQRIKLERRRLRSTLDKVERSDVKGNEESLLAPEELTVLKQWRKRECWLLAELGRLDDIVILTDGLLTLVDVENI
jgi:RNA polymerase III subunit RPC82/TFIIE alpha subunit